MRIKQGPSEAFPAGLKVEAVDPLTVRFTLSTPFAPFLYTLANDGASVINPTVLKENAADDARAYLAEHTAGSGAYMLQRWQNSSSCLSPTLIFPEINPRSNAFR
jgi:peptide/nickel transport system substrate-binding protein